MNRNDFAISACLSLALVSGAAAADTPPAASAPAPSAAAADTTPAPATPASPANSTAATPAPAAAAAPTAPATSQAAASTAVVVYIDPAITSRKWSNQSYLFRPTYLTGDLNNVGREITDRITRMTKYLSPNLTVVATPAPDGTAKFYVVPSIKRLEQIPGMFAWDDISYVLELEWRVTDSHGAVVLLDTVKAESKGSFGLAARNAPHLESAMLDQAMDESEALLKPIFADKPASSAAPPAPAATAGSN